MSGFYLTLPSNSSMEVYPDNTMTNFVTKLPNRLELIGEWEVGLVEIQYPHTWYNLQTNEGDLALYTAPDDRAGSTEEREFRISAGYYPNVNTLLKHIETTCSMALPQHKPVSFTYDNITRKISVRVQGCALYLGSRLQRMLGLRLHALPEGTTRGELVVDMDPLHSLYVYCDLVESRIVGDKLVPLLRVVPVQGSDGDMVTRIYENVHYVPLQRKSFDTLEIDIKDSTGEKVPFERGTLNVTLHFRRHRRVL